MSHLILVVDDSDIDQALIKHYLDEGGDYDVLSASSSIDALELLKEQTPHCMLIDYRLRDVSGVELLDKIAVSFPELEVPIIMLTGEGNEKVAVQAFQRGVVDYCIKDELSQQSLCQTIREAINAQLKKERLEQQRAENKYFAFHDSLTELPNRKLLLDRLTQCIYRDSRFNSGLVILYMDLDGFKEVNDTHGHEAGDAVLIEVGRRISESIRKSDTAARIGGDEFVVVLTEMRTEQNIEKFCQKLLSTLAAPYNVGSQLVHISASIGVAPYSNPTDTAEDILTKADLTMYVAKNQGKNRFLFYHSTLKQVEKTQQGNRLASELERAWQQEEFYIYAQPVIKPEGEQDIIVGIESLLRWKKEECIESIFPYLTQLNSMELIYKITRWMIFDICSHYNQFKRTQENFYLSINLSMNQLNCPQLIEYLSQATERESLSTQSIVIEVDESLFLSEHGNVRPLLLDLKQMGFRLALDNFGKNASPLRYLLKIPFDIVKIDKSIIQLAARKIGYQHLLTSLIDLSEKLELTVVCEGIESLQQLNFVKSLSQHLCCQGFFFSEPLPFKKLFNVLDNSDPFKKIS